MPTATADGAAMSIKAAVVVTSDQTRGAVGDVIRCCFLESVSVPRGSARRGGRARGSVRA
jgi:hypothetical protein